MTVLVTGATGFVMCNLARHLAEQGHAVAAADLNAPHPALRAFLGGLAGPVTFHRLDVTDAAAVRALAGEVRPERVVHGAAITAIPPGVERARFLDTVAVNVMGTLNVLEALRARGCGRIVVVSSGSVYGPRPDLAPVGEDGATDPQGVYPITKLAADALARRFAAVHGLDLAVARLASPFGPFERDTGARPLLSAIHDWATTALRGETVRVSGEPGQRRDAVYAADVASGIAALLLAPRLPHDAYNVGWGRGTSAQEALDALGRLLPGLKVEFHPGEPSPWPTVRGPLSIDRLRADTGWAPRHDIASGLAAYLDWLRASA